MRPVSGDAPYQPHLLCNWVAHRAWPSNVSKGSKAPPSQSELWPVGQGHLTWSAAHLPFKPQQTEGFRKRWFTMDDRRLMYFKDPLVRRVCPPSCC